MSDRELLELAAKAAYLAHDWPAPDYEIQWSGEGLYCSGMGKWKLWNPLTDDGDALRLAVRLSLKVDCNVYSNNPYAATRRAIVLAAAEIGRRA